MNVSQEVFTVELSLNNRLVYEPGPQAVR
jgi:hypothetical protein